MNSRVKRNKGFPADILLTFLQQIATILLVKAELSMPEKRISSHADFGEYLRQGEPGSSERAAAWMTAIGLQAVDGLRPSGYLVATACRHIEGDISIDDVRKLVDSYYHSQEGRCQAASGTEEADKVSANIANLLGEQHDLHNRNLHVSGVFCTENEPVTAKDKQAQLGCFSLQGIEKECDEEKSEQVKLVSDFSQDSQNQRIEEKTEQARLGRRLLRMLRVMAQRELAVPELMKLLRLTSRQNFMKNWLNPAVQQGLACSLHPDTPHHPRQRYFLTEQGKRLLAQHVRS